MPLLANHENRTASRVGVVSARVEGGSLVIEGEIVSGGGQAMGIVEQAKAGADWQLSIVASPYLSNSNYDGASAKAWYLFADPGVVDTFEIGYLRGRRTPTVEKGETDFDTLGIKFRVFFDLGVREQDHRGVLKFKGE